MSFLAATAADDAKNEAKKVAVGDRTTLSTLFDALKAVLLSSSLQYSKSPVYRDFRAGDVRHSQADTSKAAKHLGYEPTHRIYEGIAEAMPWYVKSLKG